MIVEEEDKDLGVEHNNVLVDSPDDNLEDQENNSEEDSFSEVSRTEIVTETLLDQPEVRDETDEEEENLTKKDTRDFDEVNVRNSPESDHQNQGTLKALKETEKLDRNEDLKDTVETHYKDFKNTVDFAGEKVNIFENKNQSSEPENTAEEPLEDVKDSEEAEHRVDECLDDGEEIAPVILGVARASEVDHLHTAREIPVHTGYLGRSTIQP